MNFHVFCFFLFFSKTPMTLFFSSSSILLIQRVYRQLFVPTGRQCGPDASYYWLLVLLMLQGEKCIVLDYKGDAGLRSKEHSSSFKWQWRNESSASLLSCVISASFLYSLQHLLARLICLPPPVVSSVSSSAALKPLRGITELKSK